MATKIETALNELSEIDGFLFANLVDSESGMSMGALGSGLDEELNSVVGTKVYKAILSAIDTLDLSDEVEDNLITLGKTYHLIRPMDSNKMIFVHLALDRKRGNLALARHKLKAFVTSFSDGFQ